LCFHKAHYAAERIASLPGFSLWSPTAFFNEFVIRCPMKPSEVNDLLLDHDILGGYDLGQYYPDLSQHMLFAVTELNTRDQIDHLVEVLSEVSNE
jgi:glycine dehydrogenase subunit 1